MSLVIKAEQVTDVFIPKGTRVKIQGCPFYLAEDAKIQEQNEDSQRILNNVLAEEKSDMDSRQLRRNVRLDGCVSKVIKSNF